MSTDYDRQLAADMWQQWCIQHGQQIPLGEVPTLLVAVIKTAREEAAQAAENIAWSSPTFEGEWALREAGKVVAGVIRRLGIEKPKLRVAQNT